MLRAIIIHQKILDDTTNSLYEKYSKMSEKIVETLDTLEDMKLQSLLLLEIVQGFLLFRRVARAENILTRLIDMLGIVLHTEGVLGKRTKFQSKPLPQLALKIKFQNSVEFCAAADSHGTTNLPKLLYHEDDTRLEKIEFIEKDENTTLTVSSVLQCLVLTKLQLVQLSQPKDKLADEELEPYLTSLLYQEHGPLAVRLSTLWTQIKLDSTHRRTVERSLKQSEQLVGMLSEPATKIPIRLRFSYVFASGLSTRWSVEAQMCAIMISLGMIKTALDTYLRLQMWDEVIACYTQLEMRHKASEIIQQELEKKPTVTLYCLMGDATDDVAYYERAWEFSERRSGRAQRHWGNFYFAKKQFEEAIPHLQKSLEINSLQEVTWLGLGFAALTLERWEEAAVAYRRYTQLEPLGFESWNNLAKAYIKMGDKMRAHKILQEALKCNFNNWKVWENFLLVSVDTGHFEDAINAFNRLIELREKYFDREVLGIIVRGVRIQVASCEGSDTSGARLIKKLQLLVGHVCVQQPLDGMAWELAAQIADGPLNRAQKLQKAYRAHTQNLTWAKNPETCEHLMRLCCDLCESSLEAITVESNEGQKASIFGQVSSARLSCQGALRAGAAEKWPNCVELETQLAVFLERLTAELKMNN